jgi:energy-converting hydrogenase Eha subunit A
MMELLILVLVIIGALFVIASGVWVAIVLARVVSARRDHPEFKSQTSAHD